MERTEMTTATLTYRLPKESLTVKPVITFKEAIKKVNEFVEAGDFIQDACKKVYNANTIRKAKMNAGNFDSAERYQAAVYSFGSRLRKRAKERREAKKQGGGAGERSRHQARDYFHAACRSLQSFLSIGQGNHGYAAFLF